MNPKVWKRLIEIDPTTTDVEAVIAGWSVEGLGCAVATVSRQVSDGLWSWNAKVEFRGPGLSAEPPSKVVRADGFSYRSDAIDAALKLVGPEFGAVQPSTPSENWA